ncbi:MAG: NifU family protein [Flavobacteriaceae bacterium]|nr:NifU family protein [Flavobacteriaceae bacterium]
MQQTVITIENTSNEAIIKFMANKILTDGSFEYHNVDEAKNSVLVQQLFHLPFVKKVFVTANFIAIERFNIVSWPDIQEELKTVIENYLNTHESLFVKEDSKQQVIEVYAESTPNPGAMKFVTNKLLTSQNIEVLGIEDTTEVPIAKALFDFPFIRQVFISENYISITKNESVEWFEITTTLRDFIKDYIKENKPVISEGFQPKQVSSTHIQPINTESLDDISKEIVSILDEYIKPAVTSDGGNIMFQSYNTNSKTVNVVLQGACSGCPSSTVTLKNGIEATLKQLLPNKVEEVIAING